MKCLIAICWVAVVCGGAFAQLPKQEGQSGNQPNVAKPIALTGDVSQPSDPSDACAVRQSDRGAYSSSHRADECGPDPIDLQPPRVSRSTQSMESAEPTSMSIG